jgi:hypothetical protein
MGIIINIDDAAERMQSGEKITFGSLDFITDQFGDLHLREPKLPMEEEEQTPLICAFFTRLEEAMNVGSCALTQHLNRNGHDVFTKLDRENDLEATLQLWVDPNWTPRSDLQLSPDHFLPGFLDGLRKAATIYSN